MKRSVALSSAVLVGSLALALALRPSQAQTEAAPTFHHAANITHAFLPLSRIQQEVLEGKEDGKSVRVVRTRLTSKKRFVIHNQSITPLTLEDREFEEGKLKEVTLDYFAQDDVGNVYYLGEDVDNYNDGKVVGHGGAWSYGKGHAQLGVMLPAHPKVGDKYQSENVPGVTVEDDEIVSDSETFIALGKTYQGCLKIKETLSDGGVEYKILAPGVGMVQDDTLKLISRKETKP